MEQDTGVDVTAFLAGLLSTQPPLDKLHPEHSIALAAFILHNPEVRDTILDGWGWDYVPDDEPE
jgi:hypothetical protein